MEINNRPPEFETSSAAINWLAAKGYSLDFNVAEDCLCYENKNKKLYPNEFGIDYTFRFEGMTDPGDESVIYAISSVDHHKKGILISAYGTYSESLSEDMISKFSNQKPGNEYA